MKAIVEREKTTTGRYGSVAWYRITIQSQHVTVQDYGKPWSRADATRARNAAEYWLGVNRKNIRFVHV